MRARLQGGYSAVSPPGRAETDDVPRPTSPGVVRRAAPRVRQHPVGTIGPRAPLSGCDPCWAVGAWARCGSRPPHDPSPMGAEACPQPFSIPPAPVLEPAAKRLAEETDPHPRIYEMSPEQGRALLDRLQAGDGVPKPDVDEEWADVDAGEWGTRPRTHRAAEGRDRDVARSSCTSTGAAGCSATATPTTAWCANWWSAPARRRSSPSTTWRPRRSTRPRSSRTTPSPDGSCARARGTRWTPPGWRCAETRPAAACPRCSP